MTDARPTPALPTNHPPVKTGRIGVLLVNLGTPDAPDAPSVRRYLREFLSDRRVVDWPRAIWLPVLNGIILNTRPSKTAKLYASIWHESGQSPLRYYTDAQTQAVDASLGEDAFVDFAMRYGNPSIESQIIKAQQSGCDRILIVPLYPQYSATTSGTVVDEVGRVLKSLAWQPTFRIAPPFHDAPEYINALAASAAQHIPHDVEQVILSYHGIPERYFKAGDPYHCHCAKTSRLLREKMGWTTEFAPIAFQSKFGPEKWLEPSTESLVIAAAEAGKKRIAVMAPAFVSDCIETLEEVAMGLSETFEEHGGESLIAIPCLNDDTPFMSFLSAHVRNELAGWA